MAAKRIRTSTAKVDIENAFSVWRSAAYQDFIETGGIYHSETKVNEANERVTAWLKQVDAMERQHNKAMLACQALDEANDDADVRAATKLAREAIEG